MTKLVLKETDNWTKEKALMLELQAKDYDDRSSADKAFISYVKLKQSFMDQAMLMCTWIIDREVDSGDTFHANQFFMSNGYEASPPDRYLFRCDVFNSLVEAINGDGECNPYSIVEGWDMWHHA